MCADNTVSKLKGDVQAYKVNCLGTADCYNSLYLTEPYCQQHQGETLRHVFRYTAIFSGVVQMLDAYHVTAQLAYRYGHLRVTMLQSCGGSHGCGTIEMPVSRRIYLHRLQDICAE